MLKNGLYESLNFSEVEKSRSGRIVKRKVFADFQQLDDDLKSITTEELREVKKTKNNRERSSQCRGNDK